MSMFRLPPTLPPTPVAAAAQVDPSAAAAQEEPVAEAAAQDDHVAGEPGDDAEVTSETSQNISPPVETNVRRETCQLYLTGECPHGMSGKTNGECSGSHPKRCQVYMRWGDKVGKGCKDEDCGKHHPTLCPKSLDLKCLDKKCPHKLHTKKCIRIKKGPVKPSPPRSGPRSGGQGGGKAVNGGKASHCSCSKSRQSYAQVAGKNSQHRRQGEQACTCTASLTSQSSGQHSAC